MYLGKSVFGRTGFQDFVCPSGAISGLFLHFSRQIAELSSFEKRCKMPRNPLPMAYTNKVKKLFKIFYKRQIAWLSSFEKRGAIPRNPLPMA